MIQDQNSQTNDIINETPVDLDTAQQVVNLEKTIHTYIMGIEQKKTELKEKRSLVKDTVENDKTYEEQKQQIDKVRETLNKTKEQIMQLPAVISAKTDVQELTGSIKDMEKSLSQYLLQYRQLSGLKEITLPDDEIYEIVEHAKLVKKKKI